MLVLVGGHFFVLIVVERFVGEALSCHSICLGYVPGVEEFNQLVNMTITLLILIIY